MFKNIPKDWRLTKIEETCIAISVGIVIKPTQYYVKKGIKAFRSANVREGKINDNDWVHISELGHQNNNKSILKKDDVLVVRTGYPGTACVVTEDFAGSNCIDILFARPNTRVINPHYLSSFINSSIGKQQVLDKQGGLAQQHLNVKELRDIKIPLPPLPEQKKIAQILSTWDKAIELLEKKIAAKEKLKKGLMQQLLTGKVRFKEFGEAAQEGKLPEGWREVNLGEIGDTYTGLSGKTKDDFGAGKPFITYLNVFQNSSIEPTQMDHVTLEENENQNLVQKGDVFFTTSSETPEEVGMTSVLLMDLEQTYLNSFCFGYRMKAKSPLSPAYCEFLLRGSLFRKEMYKLAQGSTRFNISKSAVMKLKIQVPALEEQQRISGLFSAHDIQIKNLKGHLSRLKDQKKGLMQQLLTGKVRVRV